MSQTSCAGNWTSSCTEALILSLYHTGQRRGGAENAPRGRSFGSLVFYYVPGKLRVCFSMARAVDVRVFYARINCVVVMSPTATLARALILTILTLASSRPINTRERRRGLAAEAQGSATWRRRAGRRRRAATTD